MWLRADVANPLRDGGESDTIIDHDDADQRTTTLDPRFLNDTDLRFVLQLTEPTLQHLWRSHHDGTDTLTCQPKTAPGHRPNPTTTRP